MRIYLEYKGIKGPIFGLLHVDAEMLAEHAEAAGWSCDILFEGDEGNYLARLTKENID